MIGLAFASIGIFAFTLSIERIAFWVLKAQKKSQKGLQKSLDSVKKVDHEVLPRVFIFSDPLPYLISIKSLAGRGTLFLSQGALASLNETELRTLLRAGASQLSQSGIVLGSFVSVMTLALFRCLPRSWIPFLGGIKPRDQKARKGLSPISMIGFWILCAFLPFFLKFRKVFFDSQGLPCQGLNYLLRQSRS